MADPTTAVVSESFEVDPHRNELVIKNAEPLVIGGLAALDFSTGKVEFADDAASLIPCGEVEKPYDGLVDHLTGNSAYNYKAIVRGNIVKKMTVTGAAAISDIGKLVYATDGQTATLTRPTTGLPIGFIVDWISSTTCKVFLFSLVQSLSRIHSGFTDYEIKDFGTFPTNALQGTAAVTLWQETAYQHYKFLSLAAECVAHDDGVAAGSQAINLDIDGTNVTGGVLTIAATDVDVAGNMGAVVAATAITEENEVHTGNTVKLEMAASGTGFTADKCAAVRIYALIQKLPGA